MNVLEQVKETLKVTIGEAAVAAGLVQASELPEIVLEVPKDKSHGDFATNLAMQLSRIAKQNPRAIAEQLIQKLDKEKAQIADVQIAGPGFINFRMDKSYLYPILAQVAEQADAYGAVNVGQGRKVQMEFVSANPTGSLHLGHARGAAVGDALCNVLALAGYNVTREYYINDAGNQVNNLAKSIEARYLQALGQDAEMPEDGYHGEDIKGFGSELAAEEGDRLTKLGQDERLAYFRQYGLKKNSIKSSATSDGSALNLMNGSPRLRFMRTT